MAEDWFADVKKYVADADENVVRKVVSYLGIALRNRDSSLVSFSDAQETGRVRENYLRKKLGLTKSDNELNAGLDWVKGLMSADRMKNRVTVYYLLAHYFGKLDVFGGGAGTWRNRSAGADEGPEQHSPGSGLPPPRAVPLKHPSRAARPAYPSLGADTNLHGAQHERRDTVYPVLRRREPPRAVPL